MAIAQLSPTSPDYSITTLPEEVQEPSKSIFTHLIPEARVTSLLKYVEGMPWTVNFYGQILNVDNTLEHFDPHTPNLTQPYYKINQLILQVSSPLSTSYDQSTGITTISGTAISPYNLKPNIGDVFTANVDSGEDAIFSIISVERKTYRKDTLYEINYNLYSYTTTNPNFLQTLETRVQDTYYFNKDADFFNRNVLITPIVKEAIDRLKTHIKDSQDYYFNTFANRRTGTLSIPGTEDRLYDPLLLNFLSKTVTYEAFSSLPFHRYTHLNAYIDQPSLYTAFLQRSLSTLPSIHKQYRFISTKELPSRVRLSTIGTQPVDYVLFPLTPDTSTYIGTPTLPSFSNSVLPISLQNSPSVAPIQIQTTSNNQVYNKSLHHSLFQDDYYLVSSKFYDYINDHSLYNDISYLELLFFRFLNKEAIAKEDLVIAIESYHTWTRLQQFYMLPLLWVLIRTAY